MREYLVSPAATQDINDIWDSVAEHRGEAQADVLLRSLVRVMGDLAEYPGLGHLREDLTRLPVHFFFSKPYFIVYSRDARPLYIHAIYHASRDVSSLLRTRPPAL